MECDTEAEGTYPSRLRELRNRRALSISEVAAITGISESTISRHERGQLDPDAQAIDIYRKLYRVKPIELFVVYYNN